jgi:hypothetical protein
MQYEKNQNPTFLVYDTNRAQQGSTCPFRAFKISENWLKHIYRDENKQLIVEPVM